jgi:hypothetical protein
MSGAATIAANRGCGRRRGVPLAGATSVIQGEELRHRRWSIPPGPFLVLRPFLRAWHRGRICLAIGTMQEPPIALSFAYH